MSLHKIKNFAFVLALTLGLADALVLSRLFVSQAQGQPDERIYNYGVQGGHYDRRKGLNFSPCIHPAYINGNSKVRIDFMKGYERGYFGEGQPVISNEGAFNLGLQGGRYDAQQELIFNPCPYQSYVQGDGNARKDFIKGYARGYFERL